MRKRLPLLVGVAIPLALLLVASLGRGGHTHYGVGLEAAPQLTRRALEPFSSAQALDDYLSWLGRLRADPRGLVRIGAGAYRPPIGTRPEAGLPERPSSAFDTDDTRTPYAGLSSIEPDRLHVSGSVLLLLKQGVLHAIRLGDEGVESIDRLAVVPEERSSSAEYDELLVSGETAIVIGRDAGHRRIEIVLFDSHGDGSLSRRSTHLLDAGDERSSRTAEARLVDGELVLYVPSAFYLERTAGAYLPAAGIELSKEPGPPRALRAQLPRLTSLGDDDAEGSNVLLRPHRLFAPVQLTPEPVVHLTLTCRIRPALSCKARGIIAPRARVVRVGARATYLWVSDAFGAPNPLFGAAPLVYRLPHDERERPGVVVGTGRPCGASCVVERDERVEALVIVKDDPAVLKLAQYPFERFIAEPTISARSVIDLPDTKRPPFGRFIGERLVYAEGMGVPEPTTPFHLHYNRGDHVVVPLSTAVERLETFGAVVLIADTTHQGLQFSWMNTEMHTPSPRAVEIEDPRNHGRYCTGIDGAGGLVGLALASSDAVRGPPRVRLIDFEADPPTVLGDLVGSVSAGGNDPANEARPILRDGRIFALLGDEVVEGEIFEGTLRERSRVSLSTRP